MHGMRSQFVHDVHGPAARTIAERRVHVLTVPLRDIFAGNFCYLLLLLMVQRKRELLSNGSYYFILFSAGHLILFERGIT